MSVFCPYLPTIDRVWRARDLQEFREGRDSGYYRATLHYAQSLLGEGKPAQALLQITKSLSVDLSSDAILRDLPPAYAAKRWIFENCSQGDSFLGNPVRHYQHLATRMSGPLSEVRSWRAWGCFHLAERVLPELPRDHAQISAEQLQIPGLEEVLLQIGERGWPEEASVFERVFSAEMPR